jgi:glycosyltransferase involved in cell wall biosynthesis
MKALHVVASIDDEAAGPSYSVPALGRALGQVGVETELSTVDLKTKAPSVRFTHVCFEPTGRPLRLARSTYLSAHLNAKMPLVNISHNHSLWTMPNLYCSWASRRAGVPEVVAPRGALHPRALRISTRVKQVFWHVAQKQACQNAAAFHATSVEEAGYIRDQGFRQPIVVLPNGVDIPTTETNFSSLDKQVKELVFFGRLHPIKGIPRLLESWRLLKAQGKAENWRLRIVGPDQNGYLESLHATVKSQLIPDVHFEGPVFGDDKFSLLAQADLYILPSDSENFGMTVVEALACGTPAIATKGTPWRDLEIHKCGWWADTTVEGIQGALEQAVALPLSDLHGMGIRGRNLAETIYSWGKVAEQMFEFYDWVIGGADGQAPNCVETY